MQKDLKILFFRLAAIELNRKSQMVSEAVEEVLNLVQHATHTFKSMISSDSDMLAQGRVLTLLLLYHYFKHTISKTVPQLNTKLLIRTSITETIFFQMNLGLVQLTPETKMTKPQVVVISNKIGVSYGRALKIQFLY